ATRRASARWSFVEPALDHADAVAARAVAVEIAGCVRKTNELRIHALHPLCAGIPEGDDRAIPERSRPSRPEDICTYSRIGWAASGSFEERARSRQPMWRLRRERTEIEHSSACSTCYRRNTTRITYGESRARGVRYRCRGWLMASRHAPIDHTERDLAS